MSINDYIRKRNKRRKRAAGTISRNKAKDKERITVRMLYSERRRTGI